jgi:biotin carboxyl carrier protein
VSVDVDVAMRYEVDIDGRVRHVVVHRRETRATPETRATRETRATGATTPGESASFTVAIDGRESIVDAARIDPETWSLIVDGASREVTVTPRGVAGESIVGLGPVSVAVFFNGRRRGIAEEGAQAGSGPERIVAPMPGKIVRVLVASGEPVRARQPVVVIEAMKMENELRAGRDGTVVEIHAVEGQSVDAGVLLAVIDAGAR